MSFSEQMLLILMKYNLSIFAFLDCASGVISKNSLPNPRSPSFFPRFSRRYFIISRFIFKSMIYFELIFQKGVMSVSRVIFLHVDIQFYQVHLLKKTIPSPLNFNLFLIVEK